MKNITKVIVVLVLVASMFALAACSQAPEVAEEVEAAVEEVEEAVEEVVEEAPMLEGAVIVDGSGTVYPLMANIAEEYMVNEQPEVSVQVGRAGSSAGFKKFIPGETDFSDASRQIKDSEIE